MIYFMIRLNIIFLLILSINFTTCKPNKKNSPPKDVKEYKETMQDVNKIIIRKDMDKMIGFSRNHAWDMKSDSTGFLYEIYEHGTGDTAIDGLLATINYNIRLLDGTLCYSSDSLGSQTFLINHGGVVTGLQYGILKMRVGDKARFLFPPYLAHGLIGDEDKIPPMSIIYYDVELLALNR